ncbi:hypothetical protein [Ligilactobacillus acidipiscis]
MPSTLGIKADGKYKLVETLDKEYAYFPSILAVSASFPHTQIFHSKTM